MWLAIAVVGALFPLLNPDVTWTASLILSVPFIGIAIWFAIAPDEQPEAQPVKEWSELDQYRSQMTVRRYGLWGVAKGIFLAFCGILFSQYRAEGLIEISIGAAILLASFHPRAYELTRTVADVGRVLVVSALQFVVIVMVAIFVWGLYLYAVAVPQIDLAPTWGE